MLRLTRLVAAVLVLSHAGIVLGSDEDYGGDEEDYGGGGGGGGGDDVEAAAPETRELLTVDDFNQFIDDSDASVVATFAAKEMADPEAAIPEGWDEEEDGAWVAPTVVTPALAAYNQAAQGLYNYRFAYTVSEDVMTAMKAKKAGGIYVYKSPRFVSAEHGDRPRERFPAAVASGPALTNWLSAKAQPLVGLYSTSTKERYKGPVLVIYLNLDFEQNLKGVNYVLKRARKAAGALKPKLAVAVANLADATYELEDYGLTSTKPKSDILMGISQPTGPYESKKYAPPAEASAFSAAAMSEFARAFLAGELEAYEKPPPSDDGSAGDGEGYNEDDDYSGGDEEGYEPEPDDDLKDEP